MKVQIKNYQIIKDANLEFIPGLNVIIGPSNNGKTSILKAIKALLYTVPGSTPIRYGTNYYAVGLDYNNHKVILQKGAKESLYLVDGEKYTKFGTNTPEIVSNSLNIKELVLNGNKEQLNFWDQMNYPFLIDKTSTELFKFIIDSSDSDQISQALKDMVSDRQQLGRDIDKLQGSLDILNQDIDSYVYTLEKNKDIINTCNNIIALQPKITRLNNLELLLDELNKLDVDIKNNDSDYSKIKQDLENQNKIFSNLKELSDKLNDLSNIDIELSNIDIEIDSNYKKLQNISYIINLNKIDLSRLNLLLDYKNKLIDIDNKINDIKLPKLIKFKLKDKDLEKLNYLNDILYNIENDDKQIEENEHKINISKKLLAIYNSIYDLFEVCPLCGSKLHRKE